MKKTAKSAPWIDYVVLLLILSAGSIAFLSYGHVPSKQLTSIILTACAYVVWGLWHHLQSDTLYWQVAVEYFLVAALVVALTASLLW